ncbi:glycoside hydrolase family 1 protein [Xylocopilactobacillus apicola]|uniref:6-phospho-beta-glucosidase n=1 Tax=Xylocopilactobacillus apicola TaxID=2932184 RepID=A0AAU9DVT1_9LACO|nr:glycoside hydrolase family 1 protein [Xylocopilactobacillus apicola]BDR58008.1 6-phospho-beta-glucosidase [Xylocopilactobacillus apicola]
MSVLKPDFFWGNSTSSMQTEGAYNEGGKGQSVYDVREASENTSDWKVAIDEYHRYPEDIALMKDLGMNFYRFQISWSRVQPKGEGEFNPEGIKFYHDLIDELLANGIQPMICLYHFDMPLYQAENYNGFINKTVVEHFAAYGKKMIDEYGDQVKYWITFNEQNLYGYGEAFKCSGYLKGDQTVRDLYQIQHNVALAHALVTNYLHENYPDLLIGGMEAFQEVYPATPNPRDIEAVRKCKEFNDYNLLRIFVEGKYSDEVVAFMKEQHLSDILAPEDLAEIAKTRSDFISFSYYATTCIDNSKIPLGTIPNDFAVAGAAHNPYLETNEWNWQIDPTGFYGVLMDLYSRTHLPIFPIENGVGVREVWDGKNEINDSYRIEYHRSHLEALQNAVRDGANVIGYLGWGLIDIPSSQGNVDKRYGVVYVNRTNHDLKDLARVPKASYHWLKKVIKSNGAELC